MSERYGHYYDPRVVPLRTPAIAHDDDDLNEIPIPHLLREPKRRDWMVDNLFLRGTVAMLSGIGGVGKSLLCQQLATCAVLGLPWLGIGLQRGKAALMGCEDDEDEMHRRQISINESLECSMKEVCEAGLELHPRVDRDNVLMRVDRQSWRMRRTPLMDRLAGRCRGHGIQYLFVDTATDTFDGNQNDERHVRDYVTEFRKMAVMMGGIVLFTKHPSMSGINDGSGEGGSRAWNNKVRSRLYLRREKDGDLVLDRMKGNYSDPRPFKIPLRWDRGVFKAVEAAPPRWVTD